MIDISDPNRGNLLVLLPLIYIFPSYFLHLFVLYIMLWSNYASKFRSTSFYQLFIMSSVNNMIFEAVNYFKFRAINAAIFLPFYDSLSSRSFFFTLNECVLFHTTSAQALLDMFVSFNRFSVFLLKAKYNHFWKTAIKFIFVFILIAPAATWWHFWFTDIAMILANASNPEQGWSIDQRNKEAIPWMVNSRNLGSVILVTSIVSFIMNCAVVWNIHKRMKTGKISAQEKQDLKLFFFTLFIFVNQICSLAIQTTFYVTTEPGPRNFVIRAQHFVIDINTMAPPWILLWTSSNLRIAVLSKLVCKFFVTNGITFLNASSQSQNPFNKR